MGGDITIEKCGKGGVTRHADKHVRATDEAIKSFLESARESVDRFGLADDTVVKPKHRNDRVDPPAPDQQLSRSRSALVTMIEVATVNIETGLTVVEPRDVFRAYELLGTPDGSDDQARLRAFIKMVQDSLFPNS